MFFPCPSLPTMKLFSSILIGGRRGFAERPTSKKVAAMKKLQNGNTKESQNILFTFVVLEANVNVPVVEIKLPQVGESLKNVNVFVGRPDPTLQPDSEYPNWMWSARGPCRASLRTLPFKEERTSAEEHEESSKLKKMLRAENRKAIRRNNSILKAANQ